MGELEKTVKALSEIEKKCLKAMEEGKGYSVSDISGRSSLNIDSVRRAISWLVQKGLVEQKTVTRKVAGLTKEGSKAAFEGLPERRMIASLASEGKMQFNALKESAKLNEQEFNIALGINKRNAFISITKEGTTPLAEITEVGREFMRSRTDLENAIDKIANKESVDDGLLAELRKRGLVEEKESSDANVTISALGIRAKKLKEFSEEREYNVFDPVPEIFIGKKQPYVQFLNNIRKKLIALGFKEMPERLINQEFYNFDVLFQPQNHPARTWTDTYQLKRPNIGKLPAKQKVDAIRNAHESGGRTGSRGWRYKWDDAIAAKLMPTAHGTAADARQMVEGVEFPRKYFVINRCFRPDVLDATHLIEFNQLDGFIVGEGLNFRNLLGILEEFAREIAGAEEVRFYPDYYPFTEPSVQLSAKHPELGWVEFAGAGIFRPEITESLGIKGPVLAWGMGVDRLAMFKLGIKDIRLLFSDNLTWLRKSKMVVE